MFSDVGEKFKRLKPIDFAMFFLLASFSVNVASLYISRERFFYYWDYGGFQTVTFIIADMFRKAPLAAIASIRDSIALEYNYYYTIPLIPFIWLLNPSRLSFVLSVVLVYQIPFALVVGAIATKLIPIRPRMVFWSTALLALLTPMVWAATLRAYPDISAALFIALGIFIYLVNPQIDKWWQILLMGFFTGAAMLLRRAYAYDTIVLLISISLHTVIRFTQEIRSTGQWSWRHLFLKYIRIGLVLLVAFVTLLVFGRLFLLRALSVDYNTLYASYSLGPAAVSRYYFSAFGWGTGILALLGFTLGAIRRSLNYPLILVVVFFAVISLALWIFIVRYIGVSFAQHFAIFYILGMSALFWTIAGSFRGKFQFFTISGVSAFVIANLVVGLIPVHLPAKTQPFFSQTNPPLWRPDYDEVVKLIAYLRKISTSSDPIYVTDSSWIMNFDLVVKAEQALYKNQKLSVFATPQVDSRDYYPLEQLLRARYIIVTNPFQYHLSNPEEQKVVTAVYKAFTEDWEFARDFSLMPRKFHLAQGTVLRIYQRKNPTSQETAIRTFNAMRSFIDQRPGTQPDWIVLQGYSPSTILQDQDGSYHLEIELTSEKGEPTLSLLFANIFSNPIHIKGKVEQVESGCPGAKLQVSLTDVSAKIIDGEESTLQAGDGLHDFDFTFDNQAGINLVLSLIQNDGTAAGMSCLYKVDWSVGS
jgi:hypothetical protein